MLETAQTAIRDAAQRLGYNEETIEALLEAEAEHVFEITLSSGKKFPAYRVQHNSKLGPYKGGIRFHPQVSLDEVRALATLMSLKTAAAGLPLGGGKGGIAVDPKALSKQEVEELSRHYIAHLDPHVGASKDIPAPDVNTNPEIIDWMVDELKKTQGDTANAALTGKSIGSGGSEGRTAATGRGGVIALIQLLEHLGKDEQPLTIALQGFGNVGYYFAKVLEEEYPHLKIVAIANSKTTAVYEKGFRIATPGSDQPRLEEIADFEKAEHLSAGAVFGVKADILVLAALEDAITMENVNEVTSGIVIELANGPVNSEAHDLLASRGTLILPDIIANAGGVIVSYLEWKQNLAGEHWPESRVNNELAMHMGQAMQAVLERFESRKTTLKAASFEYALERLLAD